MHMHQHSCKSISIQNKSIMHRSFLCVTFLFLNIISHGTTCSTTLMKTPSDSDLIEQTCEKCANQSMILSFSLCSTALPVIPVSRATNLPGLAVIAMELALENVTSTLATIEKLLGDESLDSYVMGCLTDCLGLYSDAVWTIVSSVDVFLSGNYEVSKTWMSFVMEAASTCQKGFEEKGQVSLLTEENYNLFQLCGIALCIIHMSTPATIGIDFLSKTMYLEDRTVRLQLWDTAGQERFRSLIPSYIRDSSVAVIVYDVASRQTFLNTSKWIEEVRSERGSDVIVVLVGNKTDLVDKRQVSTEEGEAKSRELNVMFIEASAKAGFNIKALFRKIAAALPGMETLSTTKQEDMVDVNLRSSASHDSQPQSGGCAC